jgi:hypothetical protein
MDRDRRADEKPFSMCVAVEYTELETGAVLQAAKQHCPELSTNQLNSTHSELVPLCN